MDASQVRYPKHFQVKGGGGNAIPDFIGDINTVQQIAALIANADEGRSMQKT